jgi:hypothetical protein
MKAEKELRQAITDALGVFEDGVSKEHQGEKIGNLVATLQVFTEHNFTPREQTRLFDIAARRIIEIEKVLK